MPEPFDFRNATGPEITAAVDGELARIAARDGAAALVETVELFCAICTEPIYVHADSDRATSSYVRCDDGQGCALWIADAEAIGRDAAEGCATWCVNGNVTQDHVRRVVAMMDDGDPALDDYLPRWPSLSLSGEWADDPTPLSLARDITGLDDPSVDLIDVLADAWECGVAEAFMPACEAEYRRALDSTNAA